MSGWHSHLRARSSSWAAATLAVGLLASGLGMYASDSWGIRPTVALPARAVSPAVSPVELGQGADQGAEQPAAVSRSGLPAQAVAGLRVTTRPIELVRVGDRVVAQDPRTGETTLKEVTRVFRRSSNHLRRLRIQGAAVPKVKGPDVHHPEIQHPEIQHPEGQGPEGQGTRVERQSFQWLETTNKHPFWVPGRGWVPARELVVGDRLRQSDGRLAKVVEIDLRPVAPGVPVFNLETADFHTYFVAADARSAPLLVHNCNPESLGKLYHYTAADPEQILARGLRPGSSGKVFLTTNGKLSPLQAQLDLALPPNRGLPQHLVEIDIKKLRDLGIELPALETVGRRFNMPGGGSEVGIPGQIPPGAIRKLR